MHTADQLSLASFDVTVRGEPLDADRLMPSWAASDRYGLVVNSPLGSLEASLLTQLAIASFYGVRPSLNHQPEYPEIYLFHVGGPWGDHSSFDFWPPRKEVMVATSLELLEAVNDRAVTRLAVPAARPGDVSVLADGPSTWAETSSFLSRVASSFAYAPAEVDDTFDVQIASSDPCLVANARAALSPEETVSDALASLDVDPASVLPGPSVAEDLHRWASIVRLRVHEVEPNRRNELRTDFETSLLHDGGRRTEWYRRLSPTEALAQVAGLVGAQQ